MRGLGGKIVGAARIINTNFVKKVYHPITTNEDPVQFHRFFCFFRGRNKSAKIQKNINRKRK